MILTSYELDKQRIADVAAEFPMTFGLWAFPGDTFRVSIRGSYIGTYGQVMLYTQRWTRDGYWECFAKSTPQELSTQICPIRAGLEA